MTQQERKALWDSAVELGYTPQKHYREHSVDELRELVRQLSPAPTRETVPPTAENASLGDIFAQAQADFLREVPPETEAGRNVPADGETIIRIDADGKQWIMDEVRKPSFPKPRGRIIREYIDPGVKTVEVTDNDGNVLPGVRHRDTMKAM